MYKPLQDTIRVAMLLPSLQVGGAESLVYEELSWLKTDVRFSIELHVVFEEGPLYNKFVSLGIPVRVWNAPHRSVRMLNDYFNIYRYLIEHKVDILHIHLLDKLGPITGKLAGVKTITTVHSDSSFACIRKWGIKKSDLVIACGPKVFSNLSNFVPKDKLRLLNNGISVSSRLVPDRGLVLKKYDISPHARLVVSFGRLFRLKGYDLLIEAFKQVVRFDSDACLVIGGDGPDRHMLDCMVSEAGLSGRVKLVGCVDNVHELYNVCDVYVNSSRLEGLPMTLIEAMSHGKPIVATAVGGNNDLISNNVTGLLVNPENPTLLADAIVHFLSDPAFALKCANRAYESFHSKYSIDRHCADLTAIYLNLVGYLSNFIANA